MNIVEEIHEIIKSITEILGGPLKSSEIKIVDRGCPHNPPKSLDGGASVYMYIYNGTFLKVGKANKKSNPRFTSQHYRPKAAVSTLAKFLCNDEKWYKLGVNKDGSAVREWMLNNLQRIDIMIKCDNDEESKWITTLIEGIMQYKFRPKYEG